MLKSIFDFFRQEKKFTLLFIVVSVIYMTFFLWIKSPAEKKAPSPVLQEFEEAQKKWEKNIKDTKQLEQYLKKKPVLSFWVQIFSYLAIISVSLGLLIDFILLLKPQWRFHLQRAGPPDPTVWRLSMLFKVVVLILAANLILALALGLFRRFFISDISLNVYALFHTLVIDVLCLVFILHVIKPYQGSTGTLGFNFSSLNLFQEAGVGIGGYLAILPVFLLILVALVIVANFLHYEPPPHPLVEVFLEEEKRAPWVIGFSLVLASLVGPIFEEVFFRGFCYSIFKKKWGIKWAMILSAAFFSAIHHSEFAFLPIFILGLALAYLYEKRGNLIAPITLHIVHNSIFIGYFFLAKQLVLEGRGA